MKKNHPFNVLARPNMVAGAVHTKEAGDDEKTKQDGLKRLSEEMGTAITKMDETRTKYEADSRVLLELKKSVEGIKDVDADTQKKLTEYGDSIGKSLTELQALTQGLELVKKEMDNPIYRGGSDLKDADTKAAILLQKRAFIEKGGNEAEFVEDMSKLIDPTHYRGAVRKLMTLGLQTKAEIQRSFTADEAKAFEAASLDAGFFGPELLGITVDCEIECFSLLDLYRQLTVNRSTFHFPHIQSYGELGAYGCDAPCDAPSGPEGNVTWKNNNTYDFRGAFCIQKDVLREASFDFLNFLFTSASRSHRIARNNALIMGDGVNQPMGWLSGDAFEKVQTGSQNPSHIELRQFFASHPAEYGGNTVATMHQNTFGYFAAMTDANGRFLFGDGLMSYSPDDVRERIRISNCLPDPTAGQTRGSRLTPFTAGDFIMAHGNWEMAYANVSQRPLFMEQFVGGSSAWCVAYQFGARDGGMTICPGAARTLVAGAAAVEL